MSKKRITFLISLFGILSVSPVFAIDYPEIAGITISSTTTAAQYIVYFFNLAIASGAFIAGVVLFMAGVDYVSSRGEPAKLESAKSKIRNAFLGLTILLASFMILNIINPQLTTIKIDQLGETEDSAIVIPEGTGIYLYDSPNYVSTKDPVRVTETMPSFLDDDFNAKAQSIKFVNPDSGDFKFGAVLFAGTNDPSSGSGADLRGNCSYVLNSVADLGSANGGENKPAVGRDKLSSILVFETDGGTGSVTIFNSINCIKRSNQYEEQKDEENMCTISGNSGFKNISEACPSFKGDVISVKTSGDVGVLFKATDKDSAGRCQFLESNETGCINTVKSSYVYKLKEGKYESSLSPKSFVIFSLVK
jgi:hypothetical protein